MTTFRMIMACLAVAAGAQGANAAQAETHAHTHAVPAAIDPDVDAFVCGYFTAVEKGDPAGILAQIDRDFVIKWPVGQPISDRPQLEQALQALSGRVQQKIRWKVLETQVHGDWAWARVDETSVHQPRAGGAERTLDGSHLMILRKQDGRWLLHRDYGALNAMPAPASS